MGYKHVKTDWRSFLPSVFPWMATLKHGAQKNFESGAGYLVPFGKKEGEAAVFHWEKLEDEGFKKEAEAALTSLCPGGARLSLAVVQGAPVVFVPVTGLEVSRSQRGRQVGLDAAGTLKSLQLEKLVITGSDSVLGTDVFDGIVQGAYDLTSFKNSKGSSSLPASVCFACDSYSEAKFTDILKLMRGGCLSRMVADAPPNWLNSERFAEIAEDISKELGIKCTIWGREKILEEKMGSFYSVAQGTYIDPKLIAIEIEGVNTDKCVSLVGKGLTFDSGGINLKPSNGIADMKYDMCGGAAVLGAAYYLGQAKPSTNVVCIIGAVENMPGALATRPGDVVRSRSGKSIEILNTDAEGRLVLADLLEYVVDTHKPDFIIDVATLTGAVTMALGSVGSAVLSNEQGFCDYLLRLSKDVGEPLWQLPLWPELEGELKSDVADFQNIVGPSVRAGTITAAVFLKQFVGKTRWAHLDIAGTGNDCKATGFPKKGASSFSMRTLVSACMNWES